MKRPRFKKRNIILLLAAFGLYGIFNTTNGLKSVVHLSQAFLPGTLHVKKIEGTLIHSIRLQGIEYDNENVHAAIQFLQVDWRPSQLFLSTLWIQNVSIKDTQITLKQQKNAKPAANTSPTFSWLNSIKLKHAQVENFLLRNTTQSLLQITNFTLEKNAQHGSDIIVHSPQGDIKASINLSFSPSLSWHIQLNSPNLNPGYFYKSWPSRLTLALESTGKWSARSKSWQVDLQDLHGTLRNLPIDAKGAVYIKDNQLSINQFKLKFYNAQVMADGKLEKDWNLSWLIDVPDIGIALPDSKCSITSSGKITGSRNRPNVTAAVQLKNFKYANIVMENISGNLYSSIMSTAMTLNVVGKNIKLANYTVPKIYLMTQLQRIEQGTQFDTALYTSDKNRLQANFVLSNTFDLSGKSNLTLNDLNELIQSTDMRNLGGQLQGSAVFTGKLMRPQIKLSADLVNGHVIIPAISAEVKDVFIKGGYQTNQSLNVAGHFKLGEGKAQFNGTADIENPVLPAELRVEGQNLQLNHLNEYKITFSPDLTFHYNKKSIDLQGKIMIPNADITPKDFSSVTTLPNEVIIVDKLKPRALDLPIDLTMKIEIILGNKVNLTYQHLQTQLQGTLTILKHNNSPPTGSGELYTVKGKYDAYGRALTIKDGRLIYNGNLLTNPGLEIRAVQKFKTVAMAEDKSQFNNNSQMSQVYTGSSNLMVGILVKGTLSHPAISVFSDPAGISQNDILSYLVFGTPQSQISSTSSFTLLNSLAASLNQQDSSLSVATITNKIKNTFRLNDFSLGSTEVIDPNKNQATSAATVNIGKKLGKRISVQYKVGIFTPVSILNLRYKISKQFAFQTEASNLDAGADLLYEIERD